MPEMKFIGGRLCLDFVNTVGARFGATSVLRDKLKTFDDLLAWSRLAGLASGSAARRAKRQPALAARTMTRAIRLREALYRIFKCSLERNAPKEADVDLLRNELSMAKKHQRLIRSGTGFVWTLEQPEESLDAVLWHVSLSAADLLTSPDLARLSQCSGDECGWMFLDTSRNRGRRWCDMKDCGNRAKVRRFRHRQEAGRRHK